MGGGGGGGKGVFLAADVHGFGAAGMEAAAGGGLCRAGEVAFEDNVDALFLQPDISQRRAIEDICRQMIQAEGQKFLGFRKAVGTGL